MRRSRRPKMLPPAQKCSTMASSRATKKPARAGFFDESLTQRSSRRESGGFERLDAGVDAALVAGGLVLVDQATGREAVEDRHRGLVGGFGGGGIVGVERLDDALHGGAQHRALAGVAGVADHG